MSRVIRSGSGFWAISTLSRPFLAAPTTSMPRSLAIIWEIILRMNAESSITSNRTGSPPDCGVFGVHRSESHTA
jgi:hypothetical protein